MDNENIVLLGRKFAESYLNNELRNGSCAVNSSIPTNNTALVDAHAMDRKLDRINEALLGLEIYYKDARIQPRSTIFSFPLFNTISLLSELSEGLIGAEAKYKSAELFFKNNEFVWALPMLEEWIESSSFSWHTLTESLMQYEEEVVLFLFKLLEFFSLYGENITASRLSIEQNLLITENDCQDFVTCLRSYLGTEHVTTPVHQYLLEVGHLTSFRFRTHNIGKLRRLWNMYNLPLNVISPTHGNNSMRIFTLVKPFLVLSQCLAAMEAASSSCEEFRLFAAVKIFIDCDLPQNSFHGKNIVIVATCIEVVGITADTSTGASLAATSARPRNAVRCLDVSGLHGNDARKPKKAGLNAANSLHGAVGEDADHGDPGESGGNLLLLCRCLVNAELLKIVSNGGNGGAGAAGGDGGAGANGKDGAEGKAKNDTDFSDLVIHVSYGKRGTVGGKGGDGGGCSQGGEGGYAGNIVVTVLATDVYLPSATSDAVVMEEDNVAGVGVGAGAYDDVDEASHSYTCVAASGEEGKLVESLVSKRLLLLSFSCYCFCYL
jgi:hypothetical protein